MKRLSIILISALLFHVGTLKAQTEAGAPKPETSFGSHGGALFAEGKVTLEYLQKKGALIVFPIVDLAPEAKMGPAKFTVTDKGKTTVIDNVPFKNGMYMAEMKEYVAPSVKFEANIGDDPCSMTLQMPSKQ